MTTVYLNIGGTRFETYQETLERLPYFQGVIRRHGHIPSSPEKPYFADRDPELFRHILNYARNVGEYTMPAECAEEVEYWGLELEEKPPKTNLLCPKQELPKEYDDKELSQKIRQPSYQHQISMNKMIWRGATINQPHPQKVFFDATEWEYTFQETGWIRFVYIVLPKQTPLMGFRISIKLNEQHQTEYDLQVTEQIKEIISVAGYKYVPICLQTHNNCFFVQQPDFSITISLQCPKPITSGLAYQFTAGDDREITYAIDRTWSDLILHTVAELSIKQGSVQLVFGYLQYMIWMTASHVDSVRFTNKKTGEKFVYDRVDFKYLERAKALQSKLSKNWGAVYFCYDPNDLHTDTGGYIVSDDYYLEFEPPTSGTLWQFYLQIANRKPSSVLDSRIPFQVSGTNFPALLQSQN